MMMMMISNDYTQWCDKLILNDQNIYPENEEIKFQTKNTD